VEGGLEQPCGPTGVGIMCLRRKIGTVQNLEVSIPFVERIEGMNCLREFEAFSGEQSISRSSPKSERGRNG